MSARIAPDTIAAAAPVADYRPPAHAAAKKVEPVDAAPAVQPRRNPYVEAIKLDGSVDGSVKGTAEVETPGPVTLEAPPEPSGAAYVRAVISGALSPRPTSAQELFARVGTGWVPPESEYRLADKTA